MKKLIYLLIFSFIIIYNKLETKADTLVNYDTHLEDLETPPDIISKLNDYQKQLIYKKINSNKIYDSSQFLNIKFGKKGNVTVDDIDPDLRLIYLTYKNTDNHETTMVFFYNWCKSNSLINILNEDFLVCNYNAGNTNYFEIIEFYGAIYSKTDDHVKELLETSAPTQVDFGSISLSSPSKYGLMPNSLIFGSFLTTYNVMDDSVADGTFLYYHNYNPAAEYKDLSVNNITVKNNINITQNLRYTIPYIAFIALIGLFIYLSLTAKAHKK
ncbi:hypothetical protein [Diplocloster hominis]|uniref:hypothetical protein n=1 Tax=Diplocloster hominis TaxID=3079010 RepID=UPI0031BA2092